jgi:DNA-directed RNA polymerase specialized sigma24 family protein
MSENLSARSDDSREAQATACLKAGETHRVLLLAVARKLAGSDEGGMDLFQQTLLNCHEAIQRHGFVGDRYEFYLLKSLRYLAYKEQREAKRWAPLPQQPMADPSDDDFTDGELSRAEGWAQRSISPEASNAGGPDALAQLADQMQEEIRARFSPADRIALRLHVQGESYRDIAALVGGGDHTWISRRVNRMKETLRETFAQAWAALAE